MTPDAFVRKICHDLRAPLRALKEMPAWLDADLAEAMHCVPAHILETTGMMQTQATRLDAMITGLSTLVTLRRNAPSATTNLSEVLDLDRWPDRLFVRNDLENVSMQPEHTRLVVHHLLDNAFRHSEREDVVVRLSISQTQTGGRLTVSDNGVGIAPEFLETIYEPLTTLKPRDEVEGSGMGLAIVKRIAELHQGSARTVSEKGRGTVSSFQWSDWGQCRKTN